MTASQRIAVNTLATYARTVFAMVLGLFSSRWILAALGPVDYGLMGVVGALIVFVTFLNNVTACSCSRFFAYAIGSGSREATNRLFNTALSIHIVLPVALTALGWPLGEWAILHFFNIPCERLATAVWVYRLSLISAFTSMCFTPYMGMFTAKQRIYEMSVWGSVQTVLSFALAFALTRVPGDAWLTYSAGTVAIMVFVGVCQVLRARALFEECRVHWRLWWNREQVRQVLSFSAWSLLGGLGVILRGQGISILLNKFFSPLAFPQVNASYSVGVSVSGYTQTLSSALLGALAPEITSAEGGGARGKMLALANQASKFGVVLVMLFAVPLILEIDCVLTLWLKHPPELAGPFCCLILVALLIDQVTYGQMAAVSARGQIAGYQLMVGVLLIATLPLAWAFLKQGGRPSSVMAAVLITTALQSAGRVVLAKRLVGADPAVWGREVLLPGLAVVGVSYGVGYACRAALSAPGIVQLLCVSVCSCGTTALLGWWFVLQRSERQSVLRVYERLASARKEGACAA